MDYNEAKWKKNSQGEDHNGSQLVNLKQERLRTIHFKIVHYSDASIQKRIVIWIAYTYWNSSTNIYLCRYIVV